MPKYLFVYHGGTMPDDEAERAKHMAAWGAWFQGMGAAVIDGGAPAGQTKTVRNGSVADGGGANPATGYSLINAGSIDEAVKQAKACPIIGTGGSVEVAETFEVNL